MTLLFLVKLNEFHQKINPKVTYINQGQSEKQFKTLLKLLTTFIRRDARHTTTSWTGEFDFVITSSRLWTHGENCCDWAMKYSNLFLPRQKLNFSLRPFDLIRFFEKIRKNDDAMRFSLPSRENKVYGFYLKNKLDRNRPTNLISGKNFLDSLKRL